MIEVSIPQDIRSYEPTLIGFLTTRQAVAGCAMIALVYGGYMLEKAMGIEDPLDIPIFMALAIPPFLIGWWKPYGQNFETFIGMAILYNVQAPNVRPYVIETKVIWDTIDQEDEESGKPKKAKKPPQKKRTPRSSLPKELRSYK